MTVHGLDTSFLVAHEVSRHALHRRARACCEKLTTRLFLDWLTQFRLHFGDFDPFGDFVLLFGASKLSLKILDIPVRYRERFYGRTNIHRWKHGWLLVQMLAFAALKLKFL
jgi:hypothetical protein